MVLGWTCPQPPSPPCWAKRIPGLCAPYVQPEVSLQEEAETVGWACLRVKESKASLQAASFNAALVTSWKVPWAEVGSSPECGL